jgi:hypothetical protein
VSGGGKVPAVLGELVLCALFGTLMPFRPDFETRLRIALLASANVAPTIGMVKGALVAHRAPDRAKKMPSFIPGKFRCTFAL